MFLRFITCKKLPKSKDQKYKTKEHPIVPSLVLKRTNETESNLSSEFELFSYTKKGIGPGKVDCQDTFYIQPKLTPYSCFFAVYDGHGPRGREVSLFVNDQIAKAVRKEVGKLDKMIHKGQVGLFFKKTFKSVEKKLHSAGIESYNSGTCCICMLIHKSKCYIINLGDSRAVLCRKRLNGDPQTIELSEDHKPTRPDERDRIIRSGGIIESVYYDGSPIGPLRVWTKARDAGIAMTRSMGDDHGKPAGLISEPEIRTFDLQSNDQFIIMASDGLWDVMASEEAVEFVLQHLKEGKPKNLAARKLASEAKKRWAKMDESDPEPYCDDITVIVAYHEMNEEMIPYTHK